MRRVLITSSLTVTFLLGMHSVAFSDGVVRISAPTQSNVQTIGTVPEKKPKLLNLGSLRTGDAMLPGGNTTFQERMNMRRDLALKRQNEVEAATRN